MCRSFKRVTLAVTNGSSQIGPQIRGSSGVLAHAVKFLLLSGYLATKVSWAGREAFVAYVTLSLGLGRAAAREQSRGKNRRALSTSDTAWGNAGKGGEASSRTVLVRSLPLDSMLHQRAGAGEGSQGCPSSPRLPAKGLPAQLAEPQPLSRAWR